MTGAPEKKRHHFVPQAYLQRWADSDGRVLMRRRGDDRLVVLHTKNVAVESYLYRLEGLEEGDNWLEDHFSRFEGILPVAIEALISNGRVEDDNHRGILAMLMAFQYVRTPEHLQRWEFAESVVRFAGTEHVSREVMRGYLREHHLKFEPAESEVNGALDHVQILLQGGLPTKGELFHLIFGTVESHLAPLFMQMGWCLERCRKPRFVTSDAPLTVWRTPQPEDKFSGFGLMDAEEIRFALDPSYQLVLRHGARDDVKSVHARRGLDVSAATARHCSKAVIGSRTQEPLIQNLKFSAHRPTLRFNRGPLYIAGEDTGVESRREVSHFWIQHRDD